MKINGQLTGEHREHVAGCLMKLEAPEAVLSASVVYCSKSQ